jgi:hypothetical protein
MSIAYGMLRNTPVIIPVISTGTSFLHHGSVERFG